MERNESLIKGDEEFRASDLGIKKEPKINWFYIGIILMTTAGLFFMGILLIFMLSYLGSDENETSWKPKGDKIKTEWGEKIDPDNVWQQYPRPQLQREKWMNLNGFWDYFKVKKGSLKPREPNGKILVPFPIESSLSNVMEKLTDEEEFWYKRTFEIPNSWEKNKQIILNFGAVDWKCQLYINYKLIGEHIGGYTPFYFDITNYVKYEKENVIMVKVYDPTEKGFQPRGKQSIDFGNIWYTSTSGIWQTVWLELVNPHFIEELIITPNFENKEIKIYTNVSTEVKLKVNTTLIYGKKIIKTIEGKINEDIVFNIANEDFYSWSPELPNLYDIKVTLYSLNGEVIDEVKSYTALRKISKEVDSKGIPRIFLNGQIYFNLGVLDQGYFPDGLYTPPSEEAMIFDIKKIKEMGFNTIRKHEKVESSRYYYQCDKLGILIWQDMPSGDIGGNEHDPMKIDGGTEKERTEESKNDFYDEWGKIIKYFSFFQSIIVWIPFNEAWGQFETLKVVEFTKSLDSTRLVDPASGGNYRLSGEIFDLHHYTEPLFYLKAENYINVLGEFGGLGYEIKDHVWGNNIWSYIILNTQNEFIGNYTNYIEQLKGLKEEGISSAIFTQATDVEGEVNGLITYDRKVIKYNTETLKKLNQELIKYLNK